MVDKGQTEQRQQAKKSLQGRWKSQPQRQNQLPSPQRSNQKHQARIGWDCKSPKRSLKTGLYSHQPPKADTSLLSSNDHGIAIKLALKPGAWDSKTLPKRSPLQTTKESINADRCDFLSMYPSCKTSGGHCCINWTQKRDEARITFGGFG